MALEGTFNSSSGADLLSGAGKVWEDKVLDADVIWQQIKAMLAGQDVQLPQTPRRPDVRLIVDNISDHVIEFQNPGDHSGSKPELIPPTGEKTSAVVMVKGETLDEQYKNAEILYKRYDLGTQGLSDAFVADLKAGKLSDLLAEAYGPGAYQTNAEKLVDVMWKNEDGTTNDIPAIQGAHAAYGAREATTETVFLAQVRIFMQCTDKTPELLEGRGIAISIITDRKTKAERTRPIVPSVAVTYYGEHFANMPVVILNTDGVVKEIDLKNGTVIKRAETPAAPGRPSSPPKFPGTSA